MIPETFMFFFSRSIDPCCSIPQVSAKIYPLFYILYRARPKIYKYLVLSFIIHSLVYFNGQRDLQRKNKLKDIICDRCYTFFFLCVGSCNVFQNFPQPNYLNADSFKYSVYKKKVS